MLTKSFYLTCLFTVLTLITIICMFPKYAYNDPDTFWHIELGMHMIEQGTVLHHAIHTFYDNQLPYVPHEFGFQIVIGLLYMALGWPGVYLLTASCLLLLILGLYRLTQVSRKEIGQTPQHPVMYLFVLVIACFIYYYYFTTRPQMISAVLIVWFFIYLRELRMKWSIKHAVFTLILSLAVANFHAGVWPVIAVFTAMAIIEAWTEKRLDRRNLVVFALIYVVGIINVGGLKSILYIMTVTENNFNMRINEWQPINFGEWLNYPRTVLLLFFICIMPFVLHRKLFRYMLMLGIVYLGISSYKENLFMWLFIPYFAATLTDTVPIVNKLNFKWNTRAIAASATVALLVNIVIVFAAPIRIDSANYPVKEMEFILQQTPNGIRPKVMSPYGSSGYVMYRGGNILCDGRQDPFTAEASKGVFGWTAFERSMNGFSEYLPEIAAYDQPDYVITKSGASYKHYDLWVAEFGEPVYQGDFGHVFQLVKS